MKAATATEQVYLDARLATVPPVLLATTYNGQPYTGIGRPAAEGLARYHRRMLAAAEAEAARHP